jgi:tyrosyl-tRNA synthetase
MLSTADDDVERMLKLFTFLPIAEIDSVMAEQRKDESLRVAQHRLASEFLCLVHGHQVAQETAELHKARANQRRSINLDKLTIDNADKVPSESPSGAASVALTEADLAAFSFPQLLKLAELVETIAQGTRLIASNGAYVAVPSARKGVLEWKPISQTSGTKRQKGEALEHVAWKGDQGLLLLRVGKWNVGTISIEKSDKLKSP